MFPDMGILIYSSYRYHLLTDTKMQAICPWWVSCIGNWLPDWDTSLSEWFASCYYLCKWQSQVIKMKGRLCLQQEKMLPFKESNLKVTTGCLKLKGKSPIDLNSRRISSWMWEKFVPQVIEYIECSYEEEIIIQALCYFSRHAQWIFSSP